MRIFNSSSSFLVPRKPLSQNRGTIAPRSPVVATISEELKLYGFSSFYFIDLNKSRDIRQLFLPHWVLRILWLFEPFLSFFRDDQKDT
jgi:hypothetical protein